MSRLRSIGPRAFLLVAIVVTLAGCAGPTLPTDQLLVTDDPKLAGTVVRDKVLWQYRLGLAALRAGRDDEAKQRFDDAILTMGGILADREDAKRARSLWSGEERKTFIGEPYERVMAYYYRAILYWRDGEPDNARACFRSGQLIDSVAEGDEYRADYVLLDYLDGLASAKLAADGS
ncbi:MAG TPA: tetratricopeptide repeat protein, partial [Acidobacteriota bacterium]|nr:tetratricopeptide repeat protein [Acidobacteriota bacterium]